MASALGKVVAPGDHLGSIDEYVCGEGTYEFDGLIRASVLGTVRVLEAGLWRMCD